MQFWSWVGCCSSWDSWAAVVPYGKINVFYCLYAIYFILISYNLFSHIYAASNTNAKSFFITFPQFFMLILIIFLAELAVAILAFIFREHVSVITAEYTVIMPPVCIIFLRSHHSCPSVHQQLTRDYFTKELKTHYQGSNSSSDVFTSTWNAIMTTVCLHYDSLNVDQCTIITFILHWCLCSLIVVG